MVTSLSPVNSDVVGRLVSSAAILPVFESFTGRFFAMAYTSSLLFSDNLLICSQLGQTENLLKVAHLCVSVFVCELRLYTP